MPSELATFALADNGVRSSVICLPPSVHDDGDKGFMPRIIDIARESGVSASIGDGANHWPAAHRLDAARVFRFALERGEVGSRYHAIGHEGIAIWDLTEVIGRKLELLTASKSTEEAAAHFDFFAMFMGLDAPASCAFTRERLDWTPTHRGLLADLKDGRYFDGSTSKFGGG